MAYLRKYNAILAHEVNGQPLKNHDGYPLRLIAFGLFGYKWAKYVARLELISGPRLGFWEKYGHLIMHVIFYMVVMIGMVVIFYQWGDIIERTAGLLDKIIAYEKSQKSTEGVVPALIPLLLWRFKRK